MKKKWKITILIIIIFGILSLFFGAQFVKKARQDRTWPFNTGLKLPSFVKYYAYKYTNPDSLKIETHLYEINTEFLSIPDTEAIGGGGSVNILNKDNLLVTLDNGNNWIINLTTKNFIKGPDIFFNKFLSIRDVNIFPKKKEIALLVTENDQNNCMFMRLKIYNFSFLEKKLEINNDKTLWKSESVCEDFNPFVANGGGRVISYKNSYLISLGFLGRQDNAPSSGISNFVQDISSSFGKIIRIFNKDKNEIYSIGHRNPQGLFIRKKNNLLINTEHGPNGGDEINLITKGSNYGWPCKTIGTVYGYDYSKDSEPWPTQEVLKNYGCENNKVFIDPMYSWTPSIGASQGLEYNNDEFPKWKNDLIISSLKGASLFRVHLSDENDVINVEKIKVNERIRDLIVSPSGKLVLYTDGGSLIFLSNNNR
jgi:hypothetical protein